MSKLFRARTNRAALLLLALLVSPLLAWAADPVPSSVEVYWKSTRTIVASGITSIVVLDSDIALAQIGNDTVQFVGLSRGDTVALAYVNGAPLSIVVHVVDRPIIVIPPSLLLRDSEMAHGFVGTDAQISNANGASNYDLLSNWSWAQQTGDTRFTAATQFEDNSAFSQSANLRTGSITYQTPHFGFNLLDFSQTLTGEGPEDRINNFSQPENVQLRGAGVLLNHGQDQWNFFAGTTVPYYFLSLTQTRDVAGFTFHRQQTDHLNFFAGSSFVDTPLSFSDGIHRRSYGVQTLGASYRFGKNFLIGAQGGISNGGHMLRADASYNSFRLAAYATAIASSQTFPLNQLQSLFSGTSTVKAAFNYKTTARLSQGIYYEHTDVVPGLIYQFSGSSDYLNPNVALMIARGETMNFGYTYSRNSGGFTTASSTGNRYDVSLTSMLSAHTANTAQVTVGSIQDPLQINSEDQLSIRDSVSIPVKGQTLLIGFEHQRVQPSLVAKLNQELSLLSPQLQAEFLANPVAFVDSTSLPPEVKALLAAEQPAGTSFSAGTSLALGSKLRLSPNFSLTRATDAQQNNNWTEAFGYSLVYQFRPTLQFHSSLNNVFLLNAQQKSVRTTVMMFGLQKSFAAAPGSLPFSHRNRVIEGRVFRDMNINGSYNNGEPGLAGVDVRLDDGQVATTDSEGRYKFASVSADQHLISIDLAQFKLPVRMTTRSEADADMIQQHIMVANFGVLDFARIMGSVYNDLRFEERRQPDSKGMPSITLLLDNGKNVRKLETSGTGDFEVDDVTPGEYKLSVDSASLPANFTASTEAVGFRVTPVSTVVQDLPVRALRSIAGRVMLRIPKPATPATQAAAGRNARLKNVSQIQDKNSPGNGSQNQEDNFLYIPLEGVEIKAGNSTVKTDAKGNFLLRNLPAGKLTIALVPVKPLAEGMKLPSGEVNLPADPIQVQGATIMISNAELVPYLTNAPLPNEPGMPPTGSAPIIQAKTAAPTTANPTRTIAKLEPPQLPFAKPAPAPALPSPDRVLPAPPASVPVSALPVSSAKASLPQVSVAAPLAAVTIPPRAPVCSVEQVAAARAGGQSIDCDHDFDSLGELARCYRARRAARHAQGIP